MLRGHDHSHEMAWDSIQISEKCYTLSDLWI